MFSTHLPRDLPRQLIENAYRICGRTLSPGHTPGQRLSVTQKKIQDVLASVARYIYTNGTHKQFTTDSVPALARNLRNMFCDLFLKLPGFPCDVENPCTCNHLKKCDVHFLAFIALVCAFLDALDNKKIVQSFLHRLNIIKMDIGYDSSEYKILHPWLTRT